jgi:hypothetical protein
MNQDDVTKLKSDIEDLKDKVETLENESLGTDPSVHPQTVKTLQYWANKSSISGVSQITPGTAISVSPVGGTGNVTVNNTGVTSAVAGPAITVSSATGAVTIGNGGVTSVAAGSGISVSGSTGSVTITNTNAGTSFSTRFLGSSYLFAPPSAGTTIQFGSIDIDNNSEYNSTNGHFVVKGTGTYMVSAFYQIAPGSTQTNIGADITKNGTSIVNFPSFVEANESSNVSTSATTICLMNTSDYLSLLVSRNGNGTLQQGSNVFYMTVTRVA